MIVFVGADHQGFSAKAEVIRYLQKKGLEVSDVGDTHLNPEDDFPVFAARAVHAMQASSDPEPRAILLCGSGQGLMMDANRFKGIRAGLGWSVEAARGIRNDEDSNVLALPAELMQTKVLAERIIDAWLETPFAGAARYIRRNKELDEV